VRVHSALPAQLAAAAVDVLAGAGVDHVAHGDGAFLRAAEEAASDGDAVALLGPFGSRDVCFAVEATAPAGLLLMAPVATWAGVTRDDEPGCEDDPADHRGTLLRMVARDTVVAERIAAFVRESGKRAVVLAGDHEYGVQLDGQLALAELPRADDGEVIVLCGLPGGAEIEAVRSRPGVPVIAFDGVQGEDLGERDVSMALPFAPAGDAPFDHLDYGALETRRAASLIVAAVRGGASDRRAVLDAVRAAGPFDAHGDPVDPPVWLWRAARDWTLTPERAI
jgi:hypothetical protein